MYKNKNRNKEVTIKFNYFNIC